MSKRKSIKINYSGDVRVCVSAVNVPSIEYTAAAGSGRTLVVVVVVVVLVVERFIECWPLH